MNEKAKAQVYFVYMTVGSRDEALNIAEEVIREKLAACANVFSPVTSIYEWKGELNRDEETVVVMKTHEGRLDFLTDRLVQLHSYECPCVVSVPIDSGHEPFLDWVRDQCRSE